MHAVIFYCGFHHMQGNVTFLNNLNNIGTRLDYNVFSVYLVVAMIPEAAACLVDNSYINSHTRLETDP